MSDLPLVSVCIPVYNGEQFIEETISSCLNQTYKNIEVIISDNASTDRTIELIKNFNDSRIKIFVNEKNEGLLFNFKKVFSYATGKYMSFLGADDGMTLDCIEKCVKILEDPSYSSVTLVNTFIQIINDESKTVFTKKFILGGGKFSAYWAIRANLLYGSNSIGEPNGSVWRKSAYDAIEEPKIRNGNTWTTDLDLKFELMLSGDSYVIPEALGKFRLSNQSTSKKELKFTQAKLFRQYAFSIYRDKRYKLSFFWVIVASINSILLEIARNVFYLLFIKKKD